MKIEFKNLEEKCVIEIYDYIGNYEDEFSVKTLQEKLTNANNRPLDIHINSGGGDVFEGFAIYNILKDYQGYKTVYIDGLCASIATVIAMSGNKILMHNASIFMIHNASSYCFGTSDDMFKMADALKQINEVITSVYLTKCKLSESDLTDLMNQEKFIKSDDCLKFGFIDEIIDGQVNNAQTQIAQNCLLEHIEAKLETLNKLKVFDEHPKNKTKKFLLNYLKGQENER